MAKEESESERIINELNTSNNETKEAVMQVAEQSDSSIGKIEKVIEGVVSTSEKMVLIMADVKLKMDQQQEKLDETMSKSVAVASEVENSKQKIEMIRGNVDSLSEFGTAIGGVVSNLAAVSYKNAASADNTKDSADAMSVTMGELREASVKLVELSKELEQSLGLFKL